MQDYVADSMGWNTIYRKLRLKFIPITHCHKNEAAVDAIDNALEFLFKLYCCLRIIQRVHS